MPGLPTCAKRRADWRVPHLRYVAPHNKGPISKKLAPMALPVGSRGPAPCGGSACLGKHIGWVEPGDRPRCSTQSNRLFRFGGFYLRGPAWTAWPSRTSRINDASRRLRRWPSAIIDPARTARPRGKQAGMKGWPVAQPNQGMAGPFRRIWPSIPCCLWRWRSPPSAASACRRRSPLSETCPSFCPRTV